MTVGVEGDFGAQEGSVTHRPCAPARGGGCGLQGSIPPPAWSGQFRAVEAQRASWRDRGTCLGTYVTDQASQGIRVLMAWRKRDTAFGSNKEDPYVIFTVLLVGSCKQRSWAWVAVAGMDV